MSNAQMIFTLLNVMYKVQVGVNGSLENAYDTFVIVSPYTNYPRSEQKAFPCTIETIDNLICNLYFHLIQRVMALISCILCIQVDCLQNIFKQSFSLTIEILPRRELERDMRH